MPGTPAKRFFHIHLISDSTGETLITAARAVASQYKSTHPIEHVYPLVRNHTQLDRVIAQIDQEPGIVLYTLAEKALSDHLEKGCKQMGLPCVSLLRPVFDLFQSYLGMPSREKVGAQHELNADYFNRIDALNFTLMHDDGVVPDNPEEADVILIGISRTSKTPTSIYLANRGIKTANIPLVPGHELPERIWRAKRPLVVGLIASTDRIRHVRQNRLLDQTGGQDDTAYTDRASIAEELANARKLCEKHDWPMIDVSRKSIEETAAAIIALHRKHTDKLAVAAPVGEGLDTATSGADDGTRNQS